ncbi:MAG: SDR family oxidoreductase [Actinomyces sp.]|jgi:NAD(P)-dependent dehydrogenase (short-subunit alcohol dehydrogenase family)|nr:SDR family oxidoreductase [Actinomyces sp.]MCI1788909.1 SDR family oxidoreductase [Actinomyces sp.]
MESYKNKVAVITGGGQGIGRALAVELGRRGASVVVTDINDEWGHETLEILEKEGADGSFIHHDVTKEDSWDAMVAAATAKHPTIDYLFNNAGVMLRARPTFKTTLRDWQWLVDVNFWGVLYGLRTFTSLMMSQKDGGLISTTCSTASVAPFSCWAPYTVTKAASLRLCETYQAEAAYFANPKVRYAAVLPGTVVSEISNCECHRPEEYRNEGEPLPEREPVSQPGTPEGQALGKISAELAVERILTQLDYGHFYIYTHRDLTTGLIVEQLESTLLNKPITDQLVYDFAYYTKKMTRTMTPEQRQAFEAALAAKTDQSPTRPKTTESR